MADNDDKDVKIDLSNNAQFKQMQDLMGAMGKAVQQISKGQETFQSEMRTSISGLSKPTEEPTKDPAEAATELNEMDNSQFLTHMLKAVRKEVDAATGKVSQDLTETKNLMSEKDLRGQVESFAEKHPEILGIVPEMTTKLSDHPSLKFQDAFKLVMGELPSDKLTELQDQYNLVTDKSGKEEKPAFLGLTPTSGGEVSGEANEGMTRDQAKESAWDSAVAEFPGLALSE